jgi:hypothetical protein
MLRYRKNPFIPDQIKAGDLIGFSGGARSRIPRKLLLGNRDRSVITYECHGRSRRMKYES